MNTILLKEDIHLIGVLMMEQGNSWVEIWSMHMLYILLRGQVNPCQQNSTDSIKGTIFFPPVTGFDDYCWPAFHTRMLH